MTSVQARLNAKTGAANGSPVATTTTETDTQSGTEKQGWFRRNRWNILLVIACIAVLCFGVFSSLWKTPGLAEIGNSSWSHWLWLLAFGSICYILIEINIKSLGTTAKTLKTLLIGAIFIALIIAPVIGWFAGIGSHEQKQQEKAMFLLSMPANGNSPRIYTRPGYAINYTGSGFSFHCVYRDGSELVDICKDGPMLYQYVHDKTGKPNSVTYKFVKPK